MSTRLPRIAISSVPRPVTTGYGTDQAATVSNGAIDAIARAGGVPIVLPVVDETLAAAQLDGIDGLILSGGQDLAIAPPHDADQWIDPDRDRHELELWRRASEVGLPVLGICRGAQLVNHALRGTLDPRVEGHDAGARQATAIHEVEIRPGTLLAHACGAGKIAVNTIHHQAVVDTGVGLRVSATADDGVIEAIELDGANSWFVGIQWHPELMPDSPAGDGLFEALVAEAGRRA